MIYYTPMAQMGRPKTYDEPTLKRHFDLPQSVNDMLKSMAKRDNKPDVRVVQDAIAFLFSGGKSSTREAAREESPSASGIRLDLSSQDAKQLAAIAQQCGYDSVENFATDFVINAALVRPVDEVQEIMFGDTIKRAQREMALEQAIKPKPKPKQRKNAA